MEALYFYFDILQVMGYSDTDVAEYLFKNKPRIESLVSFLCKDLTGACSRKPPPVPKVTCLTLWPFIVYHFMFLHLPLEHYHGLREYFVPYFT